MEQELKELMLEWTKEERQFLILLFFFLATVSFALAYWQVRREGSKPGKTLPVGAFFVGVVSTLWLGAWIASALLYAWSDQPEAPLLYPIALTPKWIFLFAPFAFLGLNRKISKSGTNFVQNFGHLIDRLFEPH